MAPAIIHGGQICSSTSSLVLRVTADNALCCYDTLLSLESGTIGVPKRQGRLRSGQPRLQGLDRIRAGAPRLGEKYMSFRDRIKV